VLATAVRSALTAAVRDVPGDPEFKAVVVTSRRAARNRDSPIWRARFLGAGTA
jgi:hypothetical protein